MNSKWQWHTFTDGSGEPWLAYDADGWDYSIDTRGGFQAWFVDDRIGPLRKTVKAAHNDCKRHAAKHRAALVMFGRAKLP